MKGRKRLGDKTPLFSVLFCYGSNLDPHQLLRRCPSASPVARARLHQHRLAFGGYSIGWGGAVATVLPAPGALVEGYLYVVDREDMRAMDRREGVPFVYERVRRLVVDEFGNKHDAVLYVLAGDDFEADAPSGKYFDVLWQAYVMYGFDRGRLALAEGLVKAGATADSVRRPRVPAAATPRRSRRS